GFASIKLPFWRVEEHQQPVLSAHKNYSKLARGTAHGAAFELVGLVVGSNCPRTYSHRLVVSRLSQCRRGEKNHEQKRKCRSHGSLLITVKLRRPRGLISGLVAVLLGGVS